MPWRDEQRDVEKVDYEMIYKKNEEIIEGNQAQFAIISDETIDDALERVENDNRENENEQAEQYIADENSGSKHVDIFKQGGAEDKMSEHPKKSTLKSRFTCPPRVKENELYNMMKELNCKQKELVMHILNCHKLGKVPFKIFLSGSAGVGKSKVINTLYQVITNYYDNLPGGDLDKIIVLLCAPSGKAAFLINGATLHSAFALPINQFGVNLPQLSCDLANNIREKLSKMQMLVIDEISMVSCTVLGYIDTRLRQIKGVNQSFGGVSVLAVGDLNQLPPVRDKPVYQISKRNEMAPFMDVNPLWNEFEYYELTEIMRQKDDLQFIHTLNNLALQTLSEDDIKLIKSREIPHKNDIPETAIRLYATNANVAAYNSFKIANCKSDLIISIAENAFPKGISESTKKFILQSLKKKTYQDELQTKIELKINIKYMVNRNIDVEDGLVNGACGVLRHITFNDKGTIPCILWLDFQLPRVGVRAKVSYHELMKQHNIASYLTPIAKLPIQVNVADNEKYQIIRNQFPVIPAEAITIHKSQGQTYNEICLDFTKSERRTLPMLYVALSRVTRLSGLYILGEFAIPKKTMANSTNAALAELTRLRKSKSLKLSYNNLTDENGLIIVYQNVGTFKNKVHHITNDSWFLRSDILIFSETLTNNREDLNIANYKIVFQSNYGLQSRGLICYAKNGLPIQNMAVEREWNSTAHVELFTCQVKDYYLISGYKSPKATTSMFKNILKRVMEKVTTDTKMILIGDFNYNMLNYQDHSNNFLINHVNQYKLETKLPSHSITTDAHTQIDIIFANFDDINCGVYESYFSYHKPIFAILGTKCITQLDKGIDGNDENNLKRPTNGDDFIIITDENVNRNGDDCITISDQIVDNTNPGRSSVAGNIPRDGWNYGLPAVRCNEVVRIKKHLQDSHINLFHEIMNRGLAERGIYNLAQDTAFVRVFLANLEGIARCVNNIQIIYSGAISFTKKKVIGHWICTRSDGNGCVHIYDSFNNNYLHEDQMDYLNAIYKFPKKYQFHKVQNQKNTIDCGAFAIYFATLLCYNKEPSEHRDYDVSIMRQHIATMLVNRRLEDFPEDGFQHN